MMFVTSAVGAGLAEAGHYLGGSTTGSGVGVFGQMLLLESSKTYASVPLWVLIVSVLLLVRAGAFQSHRDDPRDR